MSISMCCLTSPCSEHSKTPHDWALYMVPRVVDGKAVMRHESIMKKITGKCLCEGIKYEIEGELGPIYNCHCTKCRRWHGAAFRTRASVKTEQFHWVSGEDILSKFYSSSDTIKWFCSVCGSNLISTYEHRPDVIGIPLGGLEQDPGNRPEAHIFVASKSPWYEITDKLPQYEEWPGSEEQVKRTNA